VDLIEGDRAALTMPIHLRESVRVVMGLMYMGQSVEQMVAILSAPSLEDLTRFVVMLRASRHPVIATAIRDGLPPNAGAELPNGEILRCMECGDLVSHVPCQKCAMTRIARESPLDDQVLALEMREPAEETGYRPGSLQKIEVMRLRVSQGESPFHQEDATLVPRQLLTTCQ
jgi:hypothetical protein